MGEPMRAVLGGSLKLALAGALVVVVGCGDVGNGPATIAEAEVVRPPVRLGDRLVAMGERLSAGGTVNAGPGARAWVRHDGSARALLDGGARITVREDGFAVDAGRAWIEVAAGAHL